MSGSETPHSELGLQEAVDILRKAAVGDKVIPGDVRNCVSEVEGVSRRAGLGPAVVSSLAEVVAEWTGNVTTASKLLRSLIPTSSVPCSTVLRLLGSLKRKPLSLQLLIIRWIVLVYDIIDDRGPLHAVYGVVFLLLQVDELRQETCQLLCYLTRKIDVTHFRVQRLNLLLKRVEGSNSSESGLLALLLLYHSYYPHMVTVSPARRRKIWFRRYERELSSNLRRIQQLKGGREQLSNLIADKIQGRLENAAPPRAKRWKGSATVLPTVHFSTLGGGGGGGEGKGGEREGEEQRTVSLQEITSHSNLCYHITRLEFPSQLAVVLTSCHLAHLLSLTRDHTHLLRLTYWLEHTLGYELDEYVPGSERPGLRILLGQVLQLSHFLMEPIPTVESFLSILLEFWNGDDYRLEVMQLLTHLSLQPFDMLLKRFLDPLKKLFVSKDRDFKCSCLHTFSHLLRNTALHQILQHTAETATHKLKLFVSDQEEMEEFNSFTTIRLLIEYVDHLILIALELEGQNLLVSHAAMGFYEVVTDLPNCFNLPLIFLPSPPSLYSGLLGNNAVSLTRSCEHILKVKQSLSNLHRSERDVKMTQRFNSIVLDFCDALWRNKMFKNPKRAFPTLAFHFTSDQLEASAIPQSHRKLNLAHHPAMTGYVLQFFAETQDADTLRRLTPSAIWQEARFKEAYLEYLDQRSLSSIARFIHTFIRSA